MSALVSEVQNQIQAQNGRFLLWYTTGIVSSWKSASECYSATSPAGMNDKNYFAKGPAPNSLVSSIGYAGFQAFLNLKTGVLKGKDSAGSFLTSAQIINWATEANE